MRKYECIYCGKKLNEKWCSTCGEYDGVMDRKITKESSLILLQKEIDDLKNGEHSVYSGWMNLGERLNYLLKKYRGD